MKKACWVLALHPFSVSTEFDGVFMACRAQALHPISAAQALHPFSVSTEFDGMKKACLAQTIHPITPSAISDGAPVQECSNSLHPSAHLTKSDGASSRNAQIHYIHLRFQPYPMEDLLRNAQIRYIYMRTRPNPMERPHILGQIRWSASIYSAKSDGTPAIFNKKLPAPGTPGPEARLLTISYKLIRYLRSIPQFSKASVISPCAMTLLSPRITVPLAAASSNIST